MLQRIHDTIGDHVLHKQQIVDALMTRGADREHLVRTVGWLLVKHSGGRGYKAFLRVSQGWYCNRTKGDPIVVQSALRAVPGKIPQVIYDAFGRDTLDLDEITARVNAVRAEHNIAKRRCDRFHIERMVNGHCERCLKCFKRVSPGRYRAIPGRRPIIDPSGQHCRPKKASHEDQNDYRGRVAATECARFQALW